MKQSMTEQEIFEKVLRHLDQQGHRAVEASLDGSGRCVYLSPNGDKCAIGCLITNYHPKMDSDRWLIGTLLSLGLIPTVNENNAFLFKLQVIHDGAVTEEEWKGIPDIARSIGNIFHLDTKFLDELKFEPH